jgi:putative spermidine/putrescine transport system permease protein
MASMAVGVSQVEARETLRPRQRLAAGLLLLPVGLLLSIFFLTPFLLQIAFSLQRYDPGRGYVPGVTFHNYQAFFVDSYFQTIWWRTVWIALVVTVISVIIAYPPAMILARARGWLKTLLLLLTISPLFVPGVVRAYGWLILLSPSSPLMSALMATGLFAERPRLIYTETAVILGMVEVLLPFTILPLSAVLARIDINLIHQAQSLGASPFQTFLRVTLPLSVPGLAASSVLAFISAMGAFVTPSLLGGARIKTLAYEAYAIMANQADWGTSSMLGVVLLVTTLLGIAIYSRLLASVTVPAGR